MKPAGDAAPGPASQAPDGLGTRGLPGALPRAVLAKPAGGARGAGSVSSSAGRAGNTKTAGGAPKAPLLKRRRGWKQLAGRAGNTRAGGGAGGQPLAISANTAPVSSARSVADSSTSRPRRPADTQTVAWARAEVSRTVRRRLRWPRGEMPPRT